MADLVELNRQYQLKIALLEKHGRHFSPKSQNIVNFFVIFQEKMEKLMKFLVSKKYIKNGWKYAEFASNANSSLMRTDEEVYLNKWFEFMKKLFIEVEEVREAELKLKANQLKEARKQIKETFKGENPESFRDLEKNNFLMNDLKYLLREYFKQQNPEYIRMMGQCLDIQQ